MALATRQLADAVDVDRERGLVGELLQARGAEQRTRRTTRSRRNPGAVLLKLKGMRP